MGGPGEFERGPIGLDDVLISEELGRRTSRPPDRAAEAEAQAELTEVLASDPEAILQRLADLTLRLCHADSTGVSILEPGDGEEVLRWRAASGALAGGTGLAMARDASPCGVAIARDAVLLFALPGRHFADPLRSDLPIVEALHVPFHAGGRPVGTVWAAAHTPGRRFEAEDARLIASLSRFAAVVHRMDERGRSEREERRAGEQRQRLIVASATDYAIFTMDADRRVTSWSPGARAIFGYEEGEVVGRPADIIFTPEDRAAGAPEKEAETALREGRSADERWHVRKDGSRFYASGVLTLLGDGGPPGFVKVARDLTERKRMEDVLREARDELEARVAARTDELARANEALRDVLDARAELLRRIVTAQEDERRRISRELHDGMGQELTALILGLSALDRAIPEDTPGRDRLRELEATVRRIGREAHDLAIDLRPTALDDLGLAAALAAYVERWSERTGVAARLHSLGLDGGRLSEEVETTVYRVVQEALNNVAKHADARRVSVIVERGASDLTALIEDDGRGFDPEPAAPGAGRRSLGLLGMRERVGLVGGTLLIESDEGSGTIIRARIPIPPPNL